MIKYYQYLLTIPPAHKSLYKPRDDVLMWIIIIAIGCEEIVEDKIDFI